MAYIRTNFLRMYPWRRSDTAQVSAAVEGENHQFDYWFAWLIPATYYLPPTIEPDVDNPIDTNAADYAENPTDGITTLQVRMFDKLYADLTNKHATAQGWIRRRNVAYSLGPDAPDVTGENLFRRGWAIWSPPTVEGCIYAARITDDGTAFESGWGPAGTIINLCDLWPQYESFLTGYKANLAACWDMSAKPILAWEKNKNTISILRLQEGNQEIEGYSPLLSCNAAFVDVSERFTNTDTILFYLKDDGGYVDPWNYNTLYGPSVADNGQRQADDTRRSSKLYFRIQRENFDIEHVMCDLPFPVQSLDHIFYDGKLWDQSYQGGVYSDGTIVRPGSNPVTKWRLALTVVDGSGNRSVLESRSYHGADIVTASVNEALAATPSVTGALFDVVVSPATPADPDTMSIEPEVSGEVFDTIVTGSGTDTATITPEVSGEIVNASVANSPAPDSATLTPTVSGVLTSMIIASTTTPDSNTLSTSVFGALETV